MKPLVQRLAVILRLAVLFHRDRGEVAVPEGLALSASGRRLALQFADGWLDSHPLTVADLERERDYVAACGFELVFS